MLGLRHLRGAKSSVALCLEVCEPRSFQVIILSFVLHVRVVLRLRLLPAQPTFRIFIEQLVRTTNDVIIASDRPRDTDILREESPERQRTLTRIFPGVLAWSVSQRASRDIKIQAAIEHVTSFLLVNLMSLSSHTVRQSWAK